MQEFFINKQVAEILGFVVFAACAVRAWPRVRQLPGRDKHVLLYLGFMLFGLKALAYIFSSEFSTPGPVPIFARIIREALMCVAIAVAASLATVLYVLVSARAKPSTTHTSAVFAGFILVFALGIGNPLAWIATGLIVLAILIGKPAWFDTEDLRKKTLIFWCLVSAVIVMVLTRRIDSVPADASYLFGGMPNRTLAATQVVFLSFLLATSIRLLLMFKLADWKIKTRLAISYALVALVPAVILSGVLIGVGYRSLGSITARSVEQYLGDCGIKTERALSLLAENPEFLKLTAFQLLNDKERATLVSLTDVVNTQLKDGDKRSFVFASVRETPPVDVKPSWFTLIGAGDFAEPSETLPLTGLPNYSGVVSVDGKLVLASVRVIEREGVRIFAGAGYYVDQNFVDALSSRFGCDVELSAGTDGGAKDGQQAHAQEAPSILKVEPTREVEQAQAGFLIQPRYFAAATIPVVCVETRNQVRTPANLLATLRVAPLSTVGLLTSTGAAGGRATAIGLTVALGAGLLLLAAVAILGLRVVAGILGAVSVVRKGVQQLTHGDLECSLPTEGRDEFADLTSSFNKMTKELKGTLHGLMEKGGAQKETALARKIQLTFLPASPLQLRNFDVAGGNVPGSDVGGDLFDYVCSENGVLGVAIADVSGRGIPAALLMSNAHAALHNELIQKRPAVETVKDLNKFVCGHGEPSTFMTFFLGALDVRTRRLTYVNAGHNPPLLLPDGRKPVQLDKGGTVLGFDEGSEYVSESVDLPAGSVIVLYSDGITEAEDNQGNSFGHERLLKLITLHRSRSASELVDLILDDVHQFSQGRAPVDDRTLVVVKAV